jgi:hypothetical protein
LLHRLELAQRDEATQWANWGDCRVERETSNIVGEYWRSALADPQHGVLNRMGRDDMYRILHVNRSSSNNNNRRSATAGK